MYHLYGGKVDPVKLSSQWNSRRARSRPSDGFACSPAVLATRTIREALDESGPSTSGTSAGASGCVISADCGGGRLAPRSRRPGLKPACRRARRGPAQAARRSPGTCLPCDAVNGHAIAQRHPLAPARRTSPHQRCPWIPTSTTPKSRQGVRQFQERHGLAADGAIGPGTLRRTQRAGLGADRPDPARTSSAARWVLHEIKGEFVLVDVAGFHVSYFRDDEPVWTSTRRRRSSRSARRRSSSSRSPTSSSTRRGRFRRESSQGQIAGASSAIPAHSAHRISACIDSSGREVAPYSVDWNQYSASDCRRTSSARIPDPTMRSGS